MILFVVQQLKKCSMISENVKTIREIHHENEKFVCASGSELDFTFVCDGKKEKDCGSDEGTVCSGKNSCKITFIKVKLKTIDSVILRS